MIRFEMELVPMGTQLYGTDTIMVGSIWSNDQNTHHCYSLSAGKHHVEGRVPKVASGHRNPFHLMLAVMVDAEPQIQALGLNYVTTRFDKKG